MEERDSNPTHPRLTRFLKIFFYLEIFGLYGLIPFNITPILWNKNICTTNRLETNMTQQIYDTLWHYSEQFTRDSLQRSELITMAWREGQRLGNRCSTKLMQSLMHFRSKELKIRSAFPADEVGKSQRDAWNHSRISLNQPYLGQPDCTLEDTLVSYGQSPLSTCIVDDFNSALTSEEQTFADAIVAGYNSQEIQKLMKIGYLRFKELKLRVQEKAVEYL
jgi:hypothetical protein